VPEIQCKVSDEEILEVLATSDTCRTAAARLGITPSNLSRRMSTPAFQRQYDKLKERAMRQASDKLSFAACSAIDVLIDIAQNSNNDAVRVGAAKTLLQQSVVFNMQTNLVNKLHALEDAADYITVKDPDSND
jgi:hypothetical protein